MVLFFGDLKGFLCGVFRVCWRTVRKAIWLLQIAKKIAAANRDGWVLFFPTSETSSQVSHLNIMNDELSPPLNNKKLAETSREFFHRVHLLNSETSEACLSPLINDSEPTQTPYIKPLKQV